MRALSLVLLLAACGGPAESESKPGAKPGDKGAPNAKAVLVEPGAKGAPPAPPTVPVNKAADAEVPAGFTRFDNALAPFTTLHPTESVATTSACKDDGCEFVFSVRDAKGQPSAASRITFVVPKPAKSVDELVTGYLNGPNDLFTQNKTWAKGAETGGNASQPWLRKVATFTDGKDGVGRVLIGESAGTTFVVIEHLSMAELEKSRPAVMAIYNNLQFKPAG